MKAFLLINFIVLTFVVVTNGQEKTPAAPEGAAGPLPVSYGLVVDNSGSYRKLLENVIKLVGTIVDENKPGDEAFLVTFVDTGKIRVRQEITESGAQLRDAAENMFIEGGPTAILDAVNISARYLAENGKGDPGRSLALILITDGDERLSAAKIDEVVRRVKDSKIRIFVLALAEEKIYTKIIDRLCKESGGLKYSPKTRDEIADAAKALSKAIRTR